MVQDRKRCRKGDATAPFSIRLTADEKQQLEAKAGSVPLGVFIRDIILGDTSKPRAMRLSFRLNDREALGQLLALLGKARLANNLNQLAKAANTGSLVLDPEIKTDLLSALDDVRAMRVLLMQALGMKVEADSPPPPSISRTFAAQAREAGR
jgi:hypothetical protein